jgi:hypothetical protein
LRQASRYTVTVVVVAEFKETRDNKVLFPSQPLSVSDEYEISSGAAAADIAQLFAQDRNALDRLAKTFARRLVTSILEAF